MAPLSIFTDVKTEPVTNATNVYLAKQVVDISIRTLPPHKSTGESKVECILDAGKPKSTLTTPGLGSASTIFPQSVASESKVTHVSSHTRPLGLTPLFNSTGSVPKLIILIKVPHCTHPNKEIFMTTCLKMRLSANTNPLSLSGPL